MQRHLLVLAGTLILYGSLYPFQFQPPTADAWRQFWHLQTLWSSRGDMLGNVALFVPWGVGCTWAWRARRGTAVAMWLGALSGLGLALLAQVAQLAVPARDPALVDVFWNMLGCGLGLLAGRLLPSTATDGRGTSRHLRPALLLAACALTEWLPLVPSLDWALMKSQLHSLRSSQVESVNTMTDHAMLQLVLGWALAHWISGWRLALMHVSALALLMAGKLALMDTRLDMDTLAGAAMGACLSFGLHWTGRRADATWPSAAMIWACLALLTLGALWPGMLRDSMAPMNWLPMAGMLQGDMLENSRALLLAVTVYLAVLLAAQTTGSSLRAMTISLALWVWVLEWAQCWVETRSGDVTAPLLALLSGLLAAALGRSAGPAERTLQSPLDSKAHAVHSASRAAGQRRRRGSPVLVLGGLLLPMVALMHVGLQLPGLPYNVRELFLADGHMAVLAVFAVALLWLGIGPAWLGRKLLQSTKPWLLLPMGALACALVALLLLSASITEESIGDIAGSTNLVWFVTQKDLWGPWWREAFLRLDASETISFLERCVRWAALYGPLPLVLATMVAMLQSGSRGSGRGWWTVSLWISGGLTLWLCKAIAFDWSSTDNLNELIAHDGPLGWGGGAWLYALLVGISCNALLLAGGMTRGLLATLGALAATAIFLPAGWWLLNAGLDPAVEKYGNVFSGAQFLLGPDRKQLLPETALQLRWFAVQSALVLLIAMGVSLERRIALQAPHAG